MVSFRVVPVDLQNPVHAVDLIRLLDVYARDPMGGGSGLADAVRTHLVEKLRAVPSYRGWLAYDNEEPIGLLNAFAAFSTFAAAPLINVHDLVVCAAARGRGVGSALLSAVEAEARARSCCKLTLEVLQGNSVARNVYDRAGFASYVLDPALGSAIFLEKKLA